MTRRLVNVSKLQGRPGRLIIRATNSQETVDTGIDNVKTLSIYRRNKSLCLTLYSEETLNVGTDVYIKLAPPLKYSHIATINSKTYNYANLRGSSWTKRLASHPLIRKLWSWKFEKLTDSRLSPDRMIFKWSSTLDSCTLLTGFTDYVELIH